MKKTIQTQVKIVLVACFVVGTTQTLVAAPANLRVTPRDANSSEVQWTEGLTSHSYVKVGTGLNYRDESGTWRASEDVIELMPDGSAAALRGSLKARFSANLNTQGAITLTSVSNRVFRSHPLGLYYFEADTGRSTLVGVVKDSVAEFHPPNQLIWRDCLAGAGVQADYRVTCTKAGMEADLILVRLPDPKALGITSDSVRLEWFTEWLDLPEPRIRERVLKAETDPARGAAMAEPDLIEQTLDFRDVWFPHGRGFTLNGTETRPPGVPATIRLRSPEDNPNDLFVGKRLLQIDQRTVLVESLDWRDLQPRLAAVDGGKTEVRQARNDAVRGRRLPGTRVAKVEAPKESIRMASAAYAPRGFVLDYIIYSVSYPNTFSSGVTYFIDSSVYTADVVTFQPNCILKFANGTYLLTYGGVTCNGGPGSHSIFTSKDDDLYGERILGSTGHPTYAASPAIWVYYVDYNEQIYGVKIRWAYTGVKIDSNVSTVTNTFQESILEQCQTGLSVVNCHFSILNWSYKCGVQTPVYPPNDQSNNWFSGTFSDGCNGDTDSDGLPDSWEMQYFGALVHNGVDDPDNNGLGDGLPNLQEYQGGTDPSVANCPRDIYESKIGSQSPNARFRLNDTDSIPDAVSLADTGTGGGPALGNSGVSFASDLFDKVFGAVEFDANADVLTAGDLINGGALVAPAVDQTASGSVSLLFRTLGALTQSKRYLLSQGTSSTGAKNAFHVYFDNTAGGQHFTLEIGNTKTQILLASPVNQIVPDAWYYLAITWKHDRSPEVIWYLGRVGGVLNSGTIDLEDGSIHAVVGDNGSLHLGNKSGGGGAFQETIPPTPDPEATPYKGRLDQVAFWTSELTSGQIGAQFNALPPAGLSAIFDLTRWNLMLPVNDTGGFSGNPHVVERSQLNAGFKYVDCTKKYFYMGTVGTMVFQVPSNGAKDGSWPRSELRGTKADGEEDNWVPDNSTHTLAGTCRIMDNAVGKIIIGQIHAETAPALPAITLHVDYTPIPPSPSFLEVAVYDTPTSGSPGHHRLVSDLVNVELNKDIKYELKLVGTANSVTLQVKVWYNGETTPRTLEVPMNASWLGDELYFKAGCYYNDTVSGVDAKVTFSSLSATHQ